MDKISQVHQILHRIQMSLIFQSVILHITLGLNIYSLGSQGDVHVTQGCGSYGWSNGSTAVLKRRM